MFDLALLGFVAAFLAVGVRKPFLWVLAYLYIDILSPQKMTWHLLNSIPISLIAFVLAFGGWLMLDDKQGARFTLRQALIVMLLVYCGYTTVVADFPEAAWDKWAWVWKALVFAAFLPLTLRTRLRLEATALIMVLAAGAIIISGGMKTIFGGGGYGTLKLFVNDNTGLYEGSTISMVAIAIIPLIIWLARFGTVFPKHWTVTLFAVGLIFACLLIPVGTQTRTGLVCAGLLCVLTLRTAKRRFLYGGLMAAAVVIAIPFLPASYTQRMNTIENHQGDESARTRLAVWAWTMDYVKDHPMGGGFVANLGNKLRYEIKQTDASGEVQTVYIQDQARAYHSAYFEMLGEQGYPGLILWLTLQVLGLIQLEMVRIRLKRSEDPRDQADKELAIALQQGQVVYLFGALFIGVAYQPFIYMLIALQIALVEQVRRRRQASTDRLARPVLRGMQPLTAE